MLAAATLVACLAVSVSPARADETATSLAEDRHGFLLGLSAGGGALSTTCDGCESLGAIAVGFRVGWFVTPRLALMFEPTGVAGLKNFNVASSYVFAGAAQYWVTPRLWLKAGAGPAQFEATEGVFGQQGRTENGLGVVGAVGFELTTLGRFRLELDARATLARYDETVVGGAALLGFTWY